MDWLNLPNSPSFNKFNQFNPIQQIQTNFKMTIIKTSIRPPFLHQINGPRRGRHDARHQLVGFGLPERFQGRNFGHAQRMVRPDGLS